MFDVAIIGSGPAGISSAINCKIRNKSIVLFGQNELSHKVEISEKSTIIRVCQIFRAKN